MTLTLLTNEEFEAFASELRTIVEALDIGLRGRFKRRGGEAEVRIKPVDPRRTPLSLLASANEFDLTLGRLWSDEIAATPRNAGWVLAILDSVRDGRLRIVHLKGGDEPYYVAFLTTRGFREYAWIGKGAAGQRRMRAGPKHVPSRRVAGWQEALA